MTCLPAAETPQHRSQYLTLDCGPEFSLRAVSLFLSPRQKMTGSYRLSPYRGRGLVAALAALLVVSGGPDRVLAAEVTPATISEAKSSLRTVEIPVEGMACFVCAGTVKNTVKSLAGVLRVEVSLEKRSATVTYFGNEHVPERLVAAIDKLGYKAGTPKDIP